MWTELMWCQKPCKPLPKKNIFANAVHSYGILSDVIIFDDIIHMTKLGKAVSSLKILPTQDSIYLTDLL